MDNQEDKVSVPNNGDFQFRMGLNDNKAGMEGLDKDKINKIIMDATKGSRFYDNELKKDQQVNQRIEKMLQHKSLLTSSQITKAQIQVDRLALELERSRDLNRVIVHVDMDAFYAAVEMRDNPELKDKPMAVGSMSMLSTSNYLARRFGVRAAMPGFIAKKLCPNLTIVPLNFDKYRAVSKEVREIFAEYDPNFLPLSLDEAYLDMTSHLEERLAWPEERRRFIIRNNSANKVDLPPESTPPVPAEEDQCTSPVLFEDSEPFLRDLNPALSKQDADPQTVESVVVFGITAEEAVKEMRFRIEQRTTLTASAGIAPNMMLAKVCSDKNKPNGQYVIPHDRQAVMDFIKDLPIRKVPGIGKVTEKMLRALGIVTCTDLYQQRALLSLLFSEVSWHNFLNISLGLGSTHIEKDGDRKSMSTERTFSEINSAEEQYELCRDLCKDLASDLQKEGLKGRTVTLKLKNVKFEVKTRASTVSYAVSREEEIFSVAKEILKAEIDLSSPEPLRLRLMGVRVSGFLSEDDKRCQKSITSFLCPNKPPPTANKVFSSAVPGKGAQTSQDPAPPRESFFNQKRAARQQGLLGISKTFDISSRVQNATTNHEVSSVERNATTTHEVRSVERNATTTHEVRIVERNATTTHEVSSVERNATTTNEVSSVERNATTNHEVSCVERNATITHEVTNQEENANIRSEVISTENNTTNVSQERENLSNMDTIIQKPDLTCPICLTTQSGWDLEAFNKHIDMCLSKSPHCDDVESSTRCRNSCVGTSDESLGSNDHAKNIKNKMMSIAPYADLDDFVIDKNTACMLKKQDIKGNQKISLENIAFGSNAGLKDPDSARCTPSVYLEDSTLICPVCSIQQHTTDLAAFNRHVDVCLNKGILEELKGDTLSLDRHRTNQNVQPSGSSQRRSSSSKSTVRTKRPGASHENPASKKSKTSRASNTIDRFFK